MRADKNTITRKQFVLYSDFLNSFAQNPHTGFLATTNNENALKQSYRNLALTNRGERFYDSNKGADIQDLLFELSDPLIVETAAIKIRNTLNVLEPRGEVLEVHIADRADTHSIDFQITFRALNDQNQIYSLDLSIKRVR